MPDAEGKYKVQHEGKEYLLSLRRCPDGNVPGWIRIAVQTLIDQFHLSGDIMSFTDASANKFFPLVVDGASRYLVQRIGDDGLVDIPIPWESWLDLDADVLERIAGDFFDYAKKKIQKFGKSGSYTTIRAVVTLISDHRIRFSSSSRPEPKRRARSKKT